MQRTHLVATLLALCAVVGASGAAAAESLDRETRDRSAPNLQIWATPERISVPNERLRRIEIAGEVEDDTEVAEVYLASITSDERGLAADVVGADMGTFDDEFFVRAEDSVGDGRTYRITYIAEDAAGNQASATATVSVAPDRKPETSASAAHLRVGA